jgi:hypothetical protein
MLPFLFKKPAIGVNIFELTRKNNIFDGDLQNNRHSHLEI